MNPDSPNGQPPAGREVQSHIREALQHIHDADKRAREASKGHPDSAVLSNTLWAAEWALWQAQAELNCARSIVEGAQPHRA